MNEWVNKNVVIELKNSNKSFGKVTEVSEMGGGLIFILIKDKKGLLQMFASGEIMRIEEIG
jgi:hypothetical protein